MNIKDYMNNPGGKGSVAPGKHLLLNDLDRRYALLERDKPIELKVYIDKYSYIFHLVITTEADEKENTYDVVLKFDPSSKADRFDGTIKKYNMKIFSNCPSFTYTYAYVAHINGLLVDGLRGKYDKEIIKNPPIQRNPRLVLNYEKSIYYACKYIIEKGYLSKALIDSQTQRFNKTLFGEDIRTSSQINKEIRKEKIAKSLNNTKTASSIETNKIQSKKEKPIKKSNTKQKSIRPTKPKQPKRSGRKR